MGADEEQLVLAIATRNASNRVSDDYQDCPEYFHKFTYVLFVGVAAKRGWRWMMVEENAYTSQPETGFKHIGNSRLQNKALSMSVSLEQGDPSHSCDHKLFR